MKPSSYHIAIDAMGGDFGPRFCVLACLDFLQRFPHVQVSIVGDEPQIQEIITHSSHFLKKLGARYTIIHANEEVLMSDRPGYALRHKQNSSMWKTIELVAGGVADACVSSGNTGALMAMSRHLIKPVEGIQRPAICKPMPSANKRSYLLDLGANLDCSSEQLYQFALMGAALARLRGEDVPKVSLLNVGAEQSKGSSEIQQTAQLLSQSSQIDFTGFIEGDALYKGDVDVIVCDGFVGNVALKVSEGVAKFTIQTLKSEAQSSFIKKLLFVPLSIVLKSWWKKYNPSLYNGAALLGLKKTVVKSHGSADRLGVFKALETALEHVESNIAGRIEKSIQGAPLKGESV